MPSHVLSSDIGEYRSFVLGLISQRFAQQPPPTLWHYTNGDALIKIVESGQLFLTQISCLNDATEFRYSVGLLKDAFLRLRPNWSQNADALYLLDFIDQNISTDTSSNEWFVTCFSTIRDDLSQWRAYGGGENGYAIGFNGPQLTAIGLVHGALLAPVNYYARVHASVVDAVADATVRFFLQGLALTRAPTRDEWMHAFLKAWVNEITYLAPVMKHPGFAPEHEWRLIRRLQSGDEKRMRYFQKKSLMSRHVPLPLQTRGTPSESKMMPIDEIMVGPSRHTGISKVSVGDLLRTLGYPTPITCVAVSGIPYQEP